ncbi:MAG TPA: response regulator [Desulfotignum sp.]|nr:response regulator [Desulfotignum sp.]
MKIIVIDDEKPTLSMFKLFLTAYGYDVHIAEDGETGLSLCQKVQPDMVFTDIKMPGMDGLEVLARIRKMDLSPEVVVITGHGDMEKALRALDLGASDFINKPVERDALNAALCRAEKRRQMPGQPAFDMKVSHPPSGGILELTLSGRLSAPSVSRWRSSLDTPTLQGISKVVLTFEDSFSIDSSGISLLMEKLRPIEKSGIAIVFNALPYNYIKIFQMAGMDKMAAIFPEPSPV